MIYRKKRQQAKDPGGFFNFEDKAGKTRLSGFGHGEYILLRDELGNVWKGCAERSADDRVRYTFRDSGGRTITGVADGFGLILRDDKGKIWRGFID